MTPTGWLNIFLAGCHRCNNDSSRRYTPPTEQVFIGSFHSRRRSASCRGIKKIRPAREDLPCLRKTFRLARQMAPHLAPGQILFKAMPRHAPLGPEALNNAPSLLRTAPGSRPSGPARPCRSRPVRVVFAASGYPGVWTGSGAGGSKSRYTVDQIPAASSRCFISSRKMTSFCTSWVPSPREAAQASRGNL